MKTSTYKFGIQSVWINMIGIITSGLIFPGLTAIWFPQPEWQGPSLFITHFHPVQTATYFCGFLLVIGSLLCFTALFYEAKDEQKVWAQSALLINLLFSGIVVINYIIQTTYVPFLAKNNPPETAGLLPCFSMSNPGSFAWALEMYGWGGIGLSYILMATVFKDGRYSKTLKKLFTLNGICSIGAAFMTSVDMKWIFSVAGFISLVVWNSMVLVIDILLIKYFRFRLIQEK